VLATKSVWIIKGDNGIMHIRNIFSARIDVHLVHIEGVGGKRVMC
jgi:hypothetical protein